MSSIAPSLCRMTADLSHEQLLWVFPLWRNKWNKVWLTYMHFVTTTFCYYDRAKWRRLLLTCIKMASPSFYPHACILCTVEFSSAQSFYQSPCTWIHILVYLSVYMFIYLCIYMYIYIVYINKWFVLNLYIVQINKQVETVDRIRFEAGL